MKIFKKSFCSLLVLCMLLSLAMPAFAVSYTGGAVPIVYVQGQGAPLCDVSGKQITPVEVPDGYILDAVKACMPTFLKAFASDEWDEYKALLESYVVPFFENYQLDNNGEAKDGVHLSWTWKRSWMWNKKQNGVYAIDAYSFQQDWRLDPFENARMLDLYIQDVKAVTGSDKVNLVGRCEGGNVIMAYLAEYGSDEVNCIEMYCHSILGVDAVGAAYSGTIRLDSESATRYLDENVDIEDNVVSELIASTIEVATETYGLDLATFGLTLAASKVYDEVLKDLIMKTYGTFPGIWSLVGPDYYAKARKNIFEGKEEEYAGLIEKIDDYDVRVRSKTNELLTAAKENGVKIAMISKYGFQSIPISKANIHLSDNTVTLNNATLGATCAFIGNETLRADYLEKLEKSGKTQYLSPNKTIDASTCLFPDTTWVIYNSEHRDFPDSIHNFMVKFFRSNGEMTVFSDPEYPQYLTYDALSDTLSPTKAEDVPAPQPEKEKTKESFKDMFIRFIKSLFAFLMQLFSKKAEG